MADKDFDVIIIGAGLLGCFTARNLARYRLRVAVLERETDLCMGISRANSAIIYSGVDTKPDTLKTRLTLEGNRDFKQLCDELSVPFTRCGSLMLAFGPHAEQVLEQKFEQGQRNGVKGLLLLNAEEALQLEPRLNPTLCRALYAPSTGTVNPWELCIAAAENAHTNGVEFFFDQEVVAIACDRDEESDRGRFLVSSLDETRNRPLSQSQYRARAIVNCAGLGAAAINEMVAPISFRFKPTRGDYLILDESIEGFINHVVFHEPEDKGKGGTFVPTVEGTIMVGPSEEPLSNDEPSGGWDRGWFLVSSKDETRNHPLSHPPEGAGESPYPVAFPTTTGGLRFNANMARLVLPELPLDLVIHSFSTMRPNIYWASTDATGQVTISDESISTFHIAAADNHESFINVAGIKTPGLTCANGIGRHVTELLLPYLGQGDPVVENPNFSPLRDAAPHLAHDLRNGYLKDQFLLNSAEADYEIICRCNRVTAAEVRQAIQRPLGARTIDGVKRRTGACMGRCQGGFCTERIISLLAEELNCSPQQIIKDHRGSTMLSHQDRPVRDEQSDGSAIGKDAV